MRLLRTTLRWQAALWSIVGVGLLAAPRWTIETILRQPSLGEEAWLRAAGVMAVALAGQMVLVGHRVEDLWWWSWTFVLLEVGTALVFLSNAAVGLPEDAPAWPWWVLGLLNGAFASIQVAALAKAGTERPAL